MPALGAVTGGVSFNTLKYVMFRHQEEEQAADPAPAGPTTEELLAEIRDLLKEKGITLKDTPQGVQIIKE